MGSAPDLPNQYAQAIRFANYRFVATITCNSGVKWLRTPDYLFLIKQGAPEHIWEFAIEAQTRGTKVVTPPGNISVPFADIHIYNSTKKHGSDPHRGGYGRIKTSGPACLEFACNNGAERILLAGATGYPLQLPVYFDRDAPEWSYNKSPSSNKYMGEATTKICRVWDDVEFVCFGQPLFEVDAPNWRVEL